MSSDFSVATLEPDPGMPYFEFRYATYERLYWHLVDARKRGLRMRVVKVHDPMWKRQGIAAGLWNGAS